MSDEDIVQPAIRHLDPGRQESVRAVLEALRRVSSIAAVVLGGSCASGTQGPESDLDFGLYYHDANPFSIDAVREAAAALSGPTPPTVTGLYEWGPWVNGGAWIHTPRGKVDFLYRSIEHVERTIEESYQGIVRRSFEQQPAYGFYSGIYLAEISICVPLRDAEGCIRGMKGRVQAYPQKLKAAIVRDGLWSAEFTLSAARGFAAKGDPYGAVGCLTRAAADLTQVLFALNETWFIGDKSAMRTLGRFPILPGGYAESLAAVLGRPGLTPRELGQSVETLAGLWGKVASLTGGSYTPRFLMA